MSRWSEFLSTLGAADQVTLVGPLNKKLHTAQTPTIYVDGGGNFRSQSPAPSICLGDGDSYSGHLDKKLPVDKDFSDLAFALRDLPANILSISLLGFLGGRKDHELANLGEVHKFLRERPRFTRVDFYEHGRLAIVAFNSGDLSISIEGIFSVFALESVELQIAGACRFSLPKKTKLQPLSSHGLSNEGHGEVSFLTGGPCFILLTP